MKSADELLKCSLRLVPDFQSLLAKIVILVNIHACFWMFSHLFL